MSPCGSEKQTDGDMGLQRGGGVERSTYTSHAWVALSKTFHPHSPDLFRDHFLSAKDNNGSSKDPARVPFTQFGGGGAETTPKKFEPFSGVSGTFHQNPNTDQASHGFGAAN